jgi:hypothetical protein
MSRPATGVDSDATALASHLDLAGVGPDVDAAPDRRGVHRVIVGVDADVMIASKAGRQRQP